MTSALQNRLVGTIILVALVVIFVPDILDGKKQAQDDPFVNLPARPEMKPVIQAKPAPDDSVRTKAVRDIEVVEALPIDEPASEMLSTTVAQANAAETKSDEEPSAQTQQQTEPQTDQTLKDNTAAISVSDESQKVPESSGWVVQLGVFRHKKNVRELLDKLKKAGYRAFSRPIQTSSGELTKVFVGPNLRKQELLDAVPHLNELTNLQGRITPFTVQ